MTLPLPDTASLPKHPLIVGAEMFERGGGAAQAHVYAANGQVTAELTLCSPDDVDAAVKAARAAHPAWRALTGDKRRDLMFKLAALIEANVQTLAQLGVIEKGEPSMVAPYIPMIVAQKFRYFGGWADKIQGLTVSTWGGPAHDYVAYEPYGVVGAIIPWNGPLFAAGMVLAPALAAGNCVVLKAPDLAPYAVMRLAELFAEAGFPPGVVNVVTGFGQEVGEPLVTHPDVPHIGFTGGEIAGQKIYELAAKGLKTVTLELGGKSPNIIFDDADLDQAVKGVVSGIFAATGQICQAGSRLLLQESIHDAFIEKLIAFVGAAKLGDPASMDTQIGPVATKPQFDKIMGYIEIAKAEGARCVYGGKARPDLGPQFVEPTIFVDVRNDMRIAQEEVFGPVLSVIPFKDEAEALRIGNDVAYGLAAAVWTKDLKRAMQMTDKLKAGTVWVNNYRATSFTSPFGGFKRSGIGRESGMEAVRDYLDVKCVWISSDLEVPNPFIRR